MDNRAFGRGEARAARRFRFVAVLLAAMLVLPVAAVSRVPSGGTALAQAGTSGLYVNKWLCDGTYGRDLNQLITYCQVVNDVEFQVLGPNYQENFQGGFSLQAMPAGQYTIREFIPQGYVEPIVFCGFGPSDQQQPAESEVVTYDGYYEFALAENESVYCNWFNVPLSAFKATLYVNKHFCPPIAEFDAYSGSRNDLAANCQEPATPVDFTVTQNGAEIASGTAQGAPDALIFNDLPTGDVEVYEELPEGYGDPIVHCTVKDEFGNDRAPVTDAQVDNDRIFWRLNDGDVVFCDWFNVPGEQGTTISVVKYNCHESVGHDLGDYEDYADECTEPAEDVSFKLDGESTGNPGDQPTDANGQVTWSEMEADHYFLYEEVPPGYGIPVVYCSYYDPAALQQQDREWESYEVSDEVRIEFDIEDDQSIVCTWFNIPDDGSSLRVTKWICPEGYAYDELAALELGELQELCDEAYEDVDFELTGEAYEEERRTDQDGLASWEDFGPGEYELTEAIPAGYGTPVVWCGFTAFQNGAIVDAFPQLVELADGDTWHFENEIAGSRWFCNWFNVPGELGTITVVKYSCPDHVGYDWGDYDAYADDCPEPAEGVTFKLDGASTGNPGDFPTDAAGEVSWSEREADHYFLYEELPDGYGEPVVFCGTGQHFDPYTPSSTPDADPFSYRIEFDLEHAQHFVCYWFNVSEDWAGTSTSGQPSTQPTAEPPATGNQTPSTGNQTTGTGNHTTATDEASLTIRVYRCETGYDYHAEDADPAADCTERPEDLEFELETSNGSISPVSRSASTGDDEPGEATFSDVAAGDYRLAETDFPSDVTAFILTCESDQRDWSDYPVSPFALVAPDGSVHLSLVEGETLVCDWYEVPSGLGLTVHVYTCTGDQQTVEACDPATEPVRFILAPVTGEGDPVSFTTDEDGTAQVSDLDGTYTLSEVGQQPCAVESTDLDEDGNLILSPDRETVVDVFNCE